MNEHGKASLFIGVATGLASLVGTVVTAAACMGPLIAILLGVSGFGWLAAYAHLRVPATAATFALLAFGAYWVWVRAPRCAEGKGRQGRWSRIFLYMAAAIAVVVNVFEYVLFPLLG